MSAFGKALEAQFSFKRTNDTILHTAAHEGSLEVLKSNVNQNTSKEELDQRNHLCCTPLRLAATGGHTACAAFLLDRGASVDISDVKGQTPLHVAVKNQHSACARLLLQKGANPDGDPQNRSTPLSVAAMIGSDQLCQLLLEFGGHSVVVRWNQAGQRFTVNAMQLALAYHQYHCLKLLLAFTPLSSRQLASPFTGPFSLYHKVVTHRCGVQFAVLLYEFGLSPLLKDGKGRYPWQLEWAASGDEEEENGLQVLSFLRSIRDVPRSLKSSCRLLLWRHVQGLGRNIFVLKGVPGVPPSLLQYLTCHFL